MISRRELGRLSVAAVVVMTPLLVGSAPRWAVGVSVVAAAAAFTPFGLSKRAFTRVPPLMWWFALAIALTVLQLIPLPAGLVGWISPARYQLDAANAEALGVSASSWMPISVDAPATFVELAKLLGCALFAFAALRATRDRRGRALATAAVGVAGALVAVVTIGHSLLSVHTLYGLYTPEYAAPSALTSPFVSPNHLAAFMALTAPTAFALAIAANGWVRVTWASAGALIALVALLTESRAGVASTVVGLVLFGGLIFLRGRRGRTRHAAPRTTLAPLVVTVVCGFVLVAAIAGSGIVSEFQHTSTQELTGEQGKLSAWRESTQLLRGYPVLGVGRGAFEEAFAGIGDEGGPLHSHVENEYLQVVIDWGVLGALGLGSLAVWIAVVAIRRSRAGTFEIAASAGLAALLAHSVFDFALSLPAVTFAALVLCAILLPRELRPSRNDRALRGCRLCAGAVTLACGIIAMSSRGASSGEAVAELQEHPAAVTVGEAREVWEAHPASYGAAATLARTMFRERDPASVRVANRALQLRPGDPSTHRLVARMLLASRNPSQALVEYGAALRYTKATDRLVREILASFDDPRAIARALPLEPRAVRRIRLALRKQQRDDVLIAYLERVVEEGAPEHDLAVDLAIAARRSGESALAARAARLAYRQRHSPRASELMAQTHLDEGEPAKAVEVAEQALASDPGTRRVELTRIQAAGLVAQGRPELAIVSLSALLNGPIPRSKKAHVLSDLADLEESLGNGVQAAEYRRRAAALRPGAGDEHP